VPYDVNVTDVNVTVIYLKSEELHETCTTKKCTTSKYFGFIRNFALRKRTSMNSNMWLAKVVSTIVFGSHDWTNSETSSQEMKVILSAYPSITRTRRNTRARDRDESCQRRKGTAKEQ